MINKIFFLTFCSLIYSSLAFSQDMSFFITSVGPGDGANLGGLEGADSHCQELAEAVGSDKTWGAYLAGQNPPVEARDRIGQGPWFNAKGILIAENLTQLHINPNIHRETGLSESGDIISGRLEARAGLGPNRHDILTGTPPDGTTFNFSSQGDRTCSDWTNSGEGTAFVGHFDRYGGGTTSWNSGHPTRNGGCSQEALRSTGGDGLFYCFAID